MPFLSFLKKYKNVFGLRAYRTERPVLKIFSTNTCIVTPLICNKLLAVFLNCKSLLDKSVCQIIKCKCIYDSLFFQTSMINRISFCGFSRFSDFDGWAALRCSCEGQSCGWTDGRGPVSAVRAAGSSGASLLPLSDHHWLWTEQLLLCGPDTR